MLKQWLADESGQAMSEYGLLLALIAVALVAGITVFRGQLQTVFTNATNALKSN